MGIMLGWNGRWAVDSMLELQQPPAQSVVAAATSQCPCFLHAISMLLPVGHSTRSLHLGTWAATGAEAIGGGRTVGALPGPVAG
eukprot:2357629-Amphidinium_carterae.1